MAAPEHTSLGVKLYINGSPPKTNIEDFKVNLKCWDTNCEGYMPYPNFTKMDEIHTEDYHNVDTDIWVRCRSPSGQNKEIRPLWDVIHLFSVTASEWD